MKIVDFIREDLIVPELAADKKADVIHELAAHLAKGLDGTSADDLARVLEERERLASTAIGEGVAIPHGKIRSVRALVACIARSRAGVNFDAVDGRLTHLFFVLVAPENSTGGHLKALARISRLFKDSDFRDHLMRAPTASEMYTVLAQEDAKY